MQVSFHVDDPRLNDDLVEAAFAQALETRSKSLTGPGQAVVPDCVSCHKRPIVLGDSAPSDSVAIEAAAVIG
jgi:hypothetical protein